MNNFRLLCFICLGNGRLVRLQYNRFRETWECPIHKLLYRFGYSPHSSVTAEFLQRIAHS